MPATEQNNSYRARYEFPDLADPEFAPIRTRLVRAYLDHKVDLGIASDEAVIAHVDDITAILIGLVRRSVRERDHAWAARFEWFSDLYGELISGEAGAALDG
jgi:hypothetical protein